MTFRGWCAVLAVVLAAGSGRAQHYPGTGYPAVTPPAGSSGGWVLSVTEEGGKARLQVQTLDGLRAYCEQITIPVNGMGSAVVGVGDKVVPAGHLRAVCVSMNPEGRKGDDTLNAAAERVTRGGVDGMLLTFEGKALLQFVRQGRRAELSAERITVNLANGHVEVEMGAGSPAVVPPPPSAEPCPVTPSTPPATPSKRSSRSEPSDSTQLYSFWMSFFR